MKYFDYPTQVKFVDGDDHLSYGIAYQEYIICGCCGSVFELDDVRHNGEIFPIPWIDISEAIKGE